MSATKKATGSVSMTWDDFEPTMCPLEQGIAILYYAMDYACPEGDNHAPYLRPALTAAYDLLSTAKTELNGLRNLTDETNDD